MAAISDKMRDDNWDFFVEAKSRDPTHKIPGCENLVENLIAACEIADIHDYDTKLKKCAVWSNRAHHFYYKENDPLEALNYCNAILREITTIIYEEKGRFANAKLNSFKFQPEVKK